MLDRESTVSPCRLVEALVASCRARGVAIVENTSVAVGVGRSGHAVVHAESGDELAADTRAIVVAGGAWSNRVTENVPGAAIDVRPIRGQVLVARHEAPARVVHFRPPGADRDFYLVPQGRELWIGSTVEDVGFDERATDEGRCEVLAAARHALPDLQVEDVVEQHVGLRPKAMRLGGPFLGRWPGIDNLWVAAGHFKSGILQSPASARMLVDALVDGATIEADFALLS